MSEDNPKISPGRIWYLAGVLIWIAGCGATLGIGLGYGKSQLEAMHRVVIPGETSFELAAGDYTGFYEVKSMVDGASYVGPDSISGVRCGVVNKATGEPVTIEAAGSSVKYTLGSYSGASMFEFTIATAGTYEVGCDYDGAPIVIAVGQGVGRMIVYIIVAAFGAFALGAIAIIAVYRKRRRASA